MAYDLEAIRKKYSSNSSNAATPVSSGQGTSNNVNYSYNAGGVSVGNSSLEDLRRRYSYEPKTVTARTITSNDQARLRQQALQAGTVNEEEEKKKNKKIFGEGGVLSDAWNWIKGGVKSVAMNGIRCDDRPDPNVRPEAYQKRFVEEYVAAHPDAFDAIYLVDLRGGFNRC